MRLALVLAALALSGCNALPWIAAHKLELGYVAIAAGTVQAVGGALVQTDEVAKRALQHVREAKEHDGASGAKP